ncbi:hypothetical protein [Mongoliibacter ruber]|uniref:Uncharacterized protein n=1 Tax=Mongoliibacter ruber TaxID=1750599 RepID=A0A2T0WST6_9BACT|nr:hypothetical protein [Mongoliibacter ruber]PRY89756.1 hypothetical protein CLW00_102232 [Mongoliibacter ruber]
MKDIIIKELRKYPQVFDYPNEQDNKVYISKNIPSKKEHAAIKVHELPIKSEILWLCDRTFWGSAEDNTIITDVGIFYHESTFGDSFYWSITWEKLKRVEFIEGRDSFYFIYSEEDEDQNALLSRDSFLLNLSLEFVPHVLSALNSIASQIVDKAEILLDQLFDSTDIDEQINISHEIINNYPDSDSVYMAHLTLCYNYRIKEDWNNLLLHTDYCLDDLIDNELVDLNIDDDFFKQYITLNIYRGSALDRLNFKNRSLQHFLLVNELTYNQEEQEKSWNKILELKKALKSDFDTLNSSDKKFLVVDEVRMDLDKEKLIKVISKDEIPEIKFPVLHPQTEVLYASHPYKENLYFPFSSLEEMLFRERIDEFLHLVRCLGAVEIQIEFKKGKLTTTSEEIQKAIGGHVGREFKGVGISADLQAEEKRINKNLNSDDSGLKILQTFPSPNTSPYLPDDLTWYHNEPSWQNLKKFRVQGGLLHHRETLTSKEITKFYSKNESKLSIEVKALITNAKLDINTENYIHSTFKEEIVWDISIRFENYHEKEAIKASGLREPLKESKNELSEPELEYLEEYKFILSENLEINGISRKMLNRLAEKLKINNERREFLEKSYSDGLTDEEKEYLAEVEFCLSEVDDIGPIERRFLEKERLRLNLTKDRTDKIEIIVKTNINK